MTMNVRPRFVYNLSKRTFNPFVLQALKPRGYLLAPQKSSPAFRKLVDDVKAKRRDMFLDNGNFANIGKINSKLASKKSALNKKILQLRLKLGRSPRPEDISAGLRDSFRDLAFQAQDLSRTLTPNDEQLVADQLSFKPTCLIGVEDITMATWLSLDIEPDYTQFPRSDYRKLNESVAHRAIQALERDIPAENLDSYYPVASAVSYDTAFDAGKIFATAGIKRISMGFGAFMADKNFSDHIFINEIRRDIDGGVPMRYARTVLVARGFWDGYTSVAGVAPEGFHFLGLGAPIMIPLVTLCGMITSDLSFDATSPIRDATMRGTIYATKPAYLKLNTRKVTFRLAAENDREWNCPCPFCTDFVMRHPFRYELGHLWFTKEKGRTVKADDLRPGGGLFEAYPLLSEPAAGEVLRGEVSLARIGHNHWALEQIIESVRRASRDGRLETRVTNIVRAYTKHTSKVFARALNLSLDLAIGKT